MSNKQRLFFRCVTCCCPHEFVPAEETLFVCRCIPPLCCHLREREFMVSLSLSQTYIGSVLVSVNPYKDLEIYTKNHMERYRGVNFYEVSPHM